MSHLRRIGVRAYRSITKANLRFGEVTVIIGPSDCGKSNVVRALRDWAFNVSGSSFITLGAQQARIAVAVADDYRVMFEKSVKNKKGASRYAVERVGEEAVSYERIGGNVPEEVTDVTGIGELDIDKDTRLRIQFSMQDDPWFLLGSAWTPGRVAKVVGKISGVDALILAQRDVVQDRNAKRRDLKEAHVRVADTEEALRALEWTARAREVLDAAREREALRLARSESLRVAERAVERLRAIRVRQASIGARVAALTEVMREVAQRGYLEDVARLRRAEALEAAEADLVDRRDRLLVARDEARARITSAAVTLREAAKRGDVECPLCGRAAHEGCLVGIADEAERAARVER